MKTPASDAAGFASLGLSAPLVSAVSALGYEEPTPIQSEAIPAAALGQRHARPGRDRHRQDRRVRAAAARHAVARTPRPTAARCARWCWCRRASWRCRSPRRCTSTPRARTSTSCRSTAARRWITRSARCAAAPRSWSARPAACSITCAARRSISPRSQVLVLDEADEMLDMGFSEDIDAIVAETPETRQTALFAATFAPRIMSIAGRHLKNPEEGADRAGEARRRQAAPGPPGRLHRRQGPEDRRARPHPRFRKPEVGDHLLPHAHRSGRAHRHAERARLRRAGAARRHGAEAARSRDAVVPHREGRHPGRHRRRRARPRHRSRLARHQLRSADRRRRSTCIASAAPAASAAKAWRSRCSRRANSASCSTSSG